MLAEYDSHLIRLLTYTNATIYHGHSQYTVPAATSSSEPRYHPLHTTTQPPKPNMCVHSLYIFTKCGHFLFSEQPVLPCSSFPVCHKAHNQSSSPQTMTAHPLQSRLLDSACAACKRRAAREEREREQRLAEVRSIWTKDIKVEEARWRIHFGAKKGEGPVVVRGLTEGRPEGGRTHERSLRELEEGGWV